MLFHLKSFKDCNVILKSNHHKLCSNARSNVTENCKRHKIAIFNRPKLPIICL